MEPDKTRSITLPRRGLSPGAATAEPSHPGAGEELHQGSAHPLSGQTQPHCSGGGPRAALQATEHAGVTA